MIIFINFFINNAFFKSFVRDAMLLYELIMLFVIYLIYQHNNHIQSLPRNISKSLDNFLSKIIDRPDIKLNLSDC